LPPCAQVGWRFEGWRTQHGVERLKQGIAATPKQRVHFMAEGSERFPFWGVHVQQDALSGLLLSTSPAPNPCCWLKGKLSDHIYTQV